MSSSLYKFLLLFTTNSKSKKTTFVVGGVAHGPRGPTSYYYMLPMKVRVQGLKIALTSKLAQVCDGILMITFNSTHVWS